MIRWRKGPKKICPNSPQSVSPPVLVQALKADCSSLPPGLRAHVTPHLLHGLGARLERVCVGERSETGELFDGGQLVVEQDLANHLRIPVVTTDPHQRCADIRSRLPGAVRDREVSQAVPPRVVKRVAGESVVLGLDGDVADVGSTRLEAVGVDAVVGRGGVAVAVVGVDVEEASVVVTVRRRRGQCEELGCVLSRVIEAVEEEAVEAGLLATDPVDVQAIVFDRLAGVDDSEGARRRQRGRGAEDGADVVRAWRRKWSRRVVDDAEGGCR
jgi:hypothetical protein